MFEGKPKHKYKKAFRGVIGLLSITWLSMLAINVSGGQISKTSVLDSNGNIMRSHLDLNEKDLEVLKEYEDSWNKEDKAFRAMSLAKNGLTAYNAGDYENAISLYREALLIGTFNEDNTITLLFNIALAYESFGDSSNAERMYADIMNSVKKTSDLYYVAAGKRQLISEFMDVGKAIEYFKKALSINDYSFEANNSLGLIYLGEYGAEFTDYSKALAYTRKAHNLYPDNPNTKINLALNLIELDKSSEAITLLDEVVIVRPQSVPVNYLMMRAQFENGNIDEAKRIANKLVELYEGFKEDEIVAEILAQ